VKKIILLVSTDVVVVRLITQVQLIKNYVSGQEVIIRKANRILAKMRSLAH
jgi:hypothetical protein